MSTRTTASVFLALLLGIAAVGVPGAALALTESEVAEGLICYACPGEPLSIDRCSGGDRMRAAIRQWIGEGRTKEEILGAFAKQFGEEILTTPPKRGFNLVAYVGPFVGLLIGTAVAAGVALRWSSRRTAIGTATGGAGAPAPLDEEVTKRIERELSELDEEA